MGTVTYLVLWVFGDTFEADKFNSSHAFFTSKKLITCRLGERKAQIQKSMKKVFFPFVLLFTASVIFTGCRPDDPEVIIVYTGIP